MSENAGFVEVHDLPEGAQVEQYQRPTYHEKVYWTPTYKKAPEIDKEYVKPLLGKVLMWWNENTTDWATWADYGLAKEGGMAAWFGNSAWSF